MEFIYWLSQYCLRQVSIRGQSYLPLSPCSLRKWKNLCKWIKWGPICIEETDSLQLTCPVRITAPDCFSENDVTKISIRVFHHQIWEMNIEQWGLRVAQAQPLSQAPPFQSVPLQNQVTSRLLSSFLKTNSSLEKWGKIGILLSASLYVEITSVLTCTFPSPALANTVPAYVAGWFVCLNDLLFNKWIYIFFWASWVTSKGALFLIEEDAADRLGKVWDIHISCCHKLAEARSLFFMQHFVLF